VWPIDTAARRPLDGWIGWPQGRPFAVVLTHDVEGRAGFAQCRPLMALEREMGFRSSFNLVPEGEYRPDAQLRSELTGAGFEVGVHDLRHDGKLYRSRQGFRDAARRINGYLRDWDAVGFRSGFMFHNLEWIADLVIAYDASTFDTDPFEPQPDAAGTIFPFWYAAPGGRGYLELPYTLAQDSTLFLFMREPGIDLWIRKLDWVAAQGGMVLVNTHPDYMSFDSDRLGGGAYPAAFYRQLLEHIRTRYTGQYWHGTARELAALRPCRTPDGHCRPGRPQKEI
jgi:hypothetical protein